MRQIQPRRTAAMRTIADLFGHSPFQPLQEHMTKVTACVETLQELFEAFQNGDQEQVEMLADQVSKLEHVTDLTKNEIRNSLHKGLFFPVDRGNLLEILSIQDGIADKAEDIAVLFTLRKLDVLTELDADFRGFLEKNFDAVRGVERILAELDDLVRSSFGGAEAEIVKELVAEVAFMEHEADVIQRNLLKDLFRMEEKLGYASFHLWIRILGETGELSNLSENLADRVRMILENK